MIQCSYLDQGRTSRFEVIEDRLLVMKQMRSLFCQRSVECGGSPKVWRHEVCRYTFDPPESNQQDFTGKSSILAVDVIELMIPRSSFLVLFQDLEPLPLLPSVNISLAFDDFCKHERLSYTKLLANSPHALDSVRPHVFSGYIHRTSKP